MPADCNMQIKARAICKMHRRFLSMGMRILHFLPAESAHFWALQGLRLGVAGRGSEESEPELGLSLWGRRVANPVGLAAGLDKDAVALVGLSGLGFGLIEIGSVTPKPQKGNPRPRLFRLPEDRALINRMGFNSAGQLTVQHRLARLSELRRDSRGPLIGVNLGANRGSTDVVADYESGIRAFSPLADYLVVNISSPNTPGLRGLQASDSLAGLLERLMRVRSEMPVRPPLLIKVAPDLGSEERRAVAQVALAAKPDGLVISNTTTTRPAGLSSANRNETGGLSGAPLFPLSTAVLADFYRLTDGRLPLIGVGGIGSGAEAYAKIRAGASLVQLYTALVYEGPLLIERIKSELAGLLRRDGYRTVGDAVGADHR